MWHSLLVSFSYLKSYFLSSITEDYNKHLNWKQSASVWGHRGNLKAGLALWLETKMAPGGRDRGVVYVTVFDWLSWFPCTWTACDHHRLLLQWRHMTIWPLTWLVQLWKVPRKTPLLAYINQEFVAIKRNCLDGTPVAFGCLCVAEGLGWQTAGSPLLGTLRLCWGKFHCLSLSVERLPPPRPPQCIAT